MRIENCKLRTWRTAERATRICGLRFSFFNFQLSVVIGGLLVSGYFAWAASSPLHAQPLSFTQAKDRTGRGAFPHDQKEHIKVGCADCHLAAKEKPKNTDQPMAKDFPHSACIRCHNFAAEFFKAALGGGSRFCGVCHE